MVTECRLFCQLLIYLSVLDYLFMYNRAVYFNMSLYEFT